jgi:transcriptional regulator with XRE-family HTH domain
MANQGETMGQRLRRIREAHDLSQARLAVLAGIPIGTLRNWEQDRRSPRLDTAAAVARALSVSIDELCESPKVKPRGKAEK